MTRTIVLALMGLTLAACSNAVPDSTVAAEMSDKQIETFCGEFSGEGTTREVTCVIEGVEFSFEFGMGYADADTCVAEWDVPAGCTATVGDLRACNDAVLGMFEGMTDEEICAMEDMDTMPQECAPIMTEACSG